MIFGLSTSTIITILIAAIILVVALRIVSGLLRIGIALAILALVGYWIYAALILKQSNVFFQ